MRSPLETFTDEELGEVGWWLGMCKCYGGYWNVTVTVMKGKLH